MSKEPETLVVEQDGPSSIVKLHCTGCKHLRTQYWKDFLENDETDSGTAADCLAADRRISLYWYETNATPGWCPRLATLSSKGRGEDVEDGAPATFWMIETNDGAAWLASERGKISSVPADCLRFDSYEEADAMRNRLPQSLWLKFKTSPTEHSWLAHPTSEPFSPVAREGKRVDVKAIWREHGGRQHGPNVEHYYIEEQAFYRFAEAYRLALAQSTPAVGEGL